MKRLLFTLTTLLYTLVSFAQYPVTSIPQLIPPYSTYLSDYTLSGADKFNLNIWLNDYNEPEYDVRLVVQIEGEGVSLQTDPNFAGPIINLLPGSNTFSGADLESYFDLNNMVVSGIDEQTFRREGVLPNGMYTFCVQAFDYRRTDVALSMRGCVTAVLKRNNPPMPTYPVCGESILPTENNSIVFRWESQADNTIKEEYTFTLVEVPDGMNPNDAINGSGRTMVAPGEVMTDQTNFVYDIDQLELEPGKTYAYRIHAQDMDGLTTFENDGQSEVCWFRYGPEMNGNIVLSKPDNGIQILERTEVTPVVFTWQKPDNVEPGLSFDYQVKLVPIQEGQLVEDAMAYNFSVWDTLIEGSPTLANVGIRPSLDLPFSTSYAWQVKAYMEDLEIAQSPVWVFRKGAVLEEFFAAGNRIAVETVTSAELDNFSGTGRMKLSKAHPDSMFLVSFNNIQVRKGVDNVMTAGVILSPLTDFTIPLDFGENGPTTFRGDSVVVTTDDLLLGGRVIWEYPHATKGGEERPVVMTQQSRLLYNNRQLLGRPKLEETTFELADPNNFTIKYLSDSEFFVNDETVTTTLNLDVTLPNGVKDINDADITLPFRGIDNAFIAINTDLSAEAGIHFLEQTAIELKLKQATFDLSDENSPGLRAGDGTWKGLYFDNFQLTFPTDFDKTSQLVLDEPLTLDISLAEKPDYKGWVEPTGLQLLVNETFAGTSGPTASFNTFSDNFQDIKFHIENNSLRDGHIKGIVFIPLLDPDEAFAYTVPIDEDGLKTGFLDEDLSNRQVEFNEDKEEMHLTMTVKRAVFADNERLDMVVDLEWEGIQVLLPDCTGLSLWGNGEVGFGAPNARKAVTHVSGEYKQTYEITIDSIAAGMNDGVYAFGFIGSILVGDEGSGISGSAPSNPPKFNMVTATEREMEADASGSSGNWLTNYLEEGIYDPLNESQLTIVIPIRIKTGAVDLKGKLIAMHNNEDWGDAFYGTMDATIKKPKKFGVDATVLIGKKGEVSYWFVEVGLKAKAQDNNNNNNDNNNTGAAASAARLAKFGGQPQSKKVKFQNKLSSLSNSAGAGRKQGVKLGKVELVELRGRVYYHMNHDISQGMFKDCPKPPDAEPSNPTLVDLRIPDFDLIPDIDLPTILMNLSIPDLQELLCRMERSALQAVLAALPEPDANHLQQKVPDVDWAGLKVRYPGLTYNRIQVMFPAQDWCSIIATIPGIDWGDILLNLPSLPDFPDLCGINQFLWNKILQEVNTQMPPDSAFLVNEGHITSEEWVQVQFTGPSIVWTDLTRQFPHKNWCGVVVFLPGIDWGSIMLEINLPTLDLPDIRFLLKKLNINWDAFLPSLPDLSFDMNVVLPPLTPVNVDMSVIGEVDIDYEIDASTSYGGMLMVGMQDTPTGGKLVQGFAALEMSFDASFDLKQIGLQVGANFMNAPNGESMVEALGCMSYTVATETFVADLEAKAKKGGICGEGYLHLETSPGRFKMDLGTETYPIRVQKCPIGEGALGWFNIDSGPSGTVAGIGLGLSLHADLETEKFGIDGVCQVNGYFRSHFETAIFAEAQVEPSFELKEAGVRFDAGVDIGVTIEGAICPFGDINALHLGLSGDLRYNFDDSHLRGTLKGEAELFGLFDAEFEFEMDEEVAL